MRCPVCQYVNPDVARFCANCGTRLAPADPGPPARQGADGERKHATVLFADVVGSTAIAERIDPETWTEIANEAFDLMRDAIERYGGRVARYMGDGVLALFGDPVAHEDDPERAVRAALDLVRAVALFAPRVEAEIGQPFRVRVGVNTGLTVIGTVGSGPAGETTAMGDAPNVAARLQGAAEPNMVLVGAETASLVAHAVELEPRGEVEVRGRSDPVETFRAVRARPLGERRRPAAVGLRAPLVGRQRELGLLRDAARDLRSGTGRTVLVVGEAGVGKSRLVAELRKVLPSGATRWLEGRAVSFAQGIPYFPWRQVLLASVGASEADTPEAVRSKLHEEVCTCCARPGGDLPYLETVVAVESEESLRTLAGVDGEQLVPRIVEATQGYVCSLAAMTPTVLAFDDLHWADPATVDLVASVAAVTREVPLLVLGVMRPEGGVPSSELPRRLRDAVGDRLLELHLEPLSEAASAQLLTHLLDVDGLPQALRDTILERAEGNPFFLEEVLRALVDAGHVVRDEDRWRVLDSVATFTVPDTLAGVLGSRFDRLPEATKRVAQAAAVVGRSFPYRVLQRVFEAAPDVERVPDLEPHLGTLSSEDLVRERSPDPEREYAFKHALTHQAVYDRLLLRRRRELHRRTGLVLEALHGHDRDDVVPVLAHHFALAEDWERAAGYAMRAGLRTLKLGANADAYRSFDAAIGAMEHTPDTDPAALVDALLGWSEAAIRLREHERPDQRSRMVERSERAVALTRELGDDRRRTEALVTLGNVHQLSGFPGTAFDYLLEAQELARELGDDALFLMPFWAATEQLLNDDPLRAARQFDEVVALARTVRNPGIEAHALASKATAHARLGEFHDAREAIEAALEVVPRSRSTIKEADVHILAGSTYLEMGDLERASEHGRRGRDLALSVRGMECACGGHQIVGLVELHARRWARAQEELSSALVAGAGTRMETVLHQIRGLHAASRVRSGEVRAVHEIEAEWATAERMNDGYGHATLGHEIAEAHLRADEPAAAVRAILPAIAYFRERGMRGYLARALETLAVAQDAQGRDEGAEAARAEAEALWAEIRRLETTSALEAAVDG